MTRALPTIRAASVPLALLSVVALVGCGGPSAPGSAPGSAVRSTRPEVSVAEGPFETPPLLLMRRPTTAPVHRERPPRRFVRQGQSGATAQPPEAAVPVGVRAPSLRSPITFSLFEGIGDLIAGYDVTAVPPDSTGAVGPSHYLEAVNTAFAVYNKTTGALLLGPVDINSLFQNSGNSCATNNDGDPAVVYDQLADRWVVSQFSVSNLTTTFYECVAVSKTADPLGAWWAYTFQYDFFPDYPKLAMWPDAYYATYAMFSDGSGSASYLGPKICALDRAAMLQGATATQQCFSGGASVGIMLPANLDGSTPPPSGSPAYAMSDSDSATAPFNYLLFWKVHINWANPASSFLSPASHISTARYSLPCGSGGVCVPQAGTSNQLDALADRLMARLVYRNFGDHEAIVASHTVASGNTAGVRWWEIRSPASTPTVYQEGTVPSVTDSTYRWMPSIAMDKAGNMAVGYSTSGSTLTPGIAVSGRLVSDTSGTMLQGETTIFVGPGVQTGAAANGAERWGDYTSMTVDPTDDCTFYYVNQYIPTNGLGNWRTKVASFSFPSCSQATPDFTITAAPTTLTVAQGATGTSTISTTQVGAAGTVTLVAVVTPAGTGVTASLSPTSVAAGASSTLTVTASASATPATYTVTVTGTEGANTHPATVTVTVPSPAQPDFTIAAAPSTLTVVQGSTGTSTISTTQVGGAGTVALSVAVYPPSSGVTATLNPASVTAGASSTLSITPTTLPSTAAVIVTVTGTEGSNTHSAAVTVTVSAPPSPAPSGGGCSTSGGNAGSFLPLLALFFVARRRKGRYAPAP